MELNVISFLREHSLIDLEKKYGIKAKRGKINNNLVLLKYDQLNSPTSHPIVLECRGLILDESDDWRIISFPYKRFANYGEGWAAEIDWETARTYEKLDGSLMTMYYYNGWQVASSGVPDASGELMGTTTTFQDLFFKVWAELKYSTKYMDQNVCYMFELCTKYNRVVVRHPESKIVLHGARRLSDLRELNPIVEADRNDWDCVKIFPLKSWDDITAAAKTLEPMKSEGYVVCDANYNRVKVKSPQYVAVAHMKDGFTTRRMLEIVRTNENSEFLSYYPEYTELYYDIRAKYERFLGRIEGFYDGIKHIDDRKQFALLATTQKFSGTLFNLKFGKIDDPKQSLADMNIRQLEQWLGMKSIEL